MSKSLIKYSLFQRRRKFDPLTLFRQNKSITYEEFVKALASKGSDSPGVEYFQRVKLHFEGLNKPPAIVKNVEEVVAKPTIQPKKPSNVKEVAITTEEVAITTEEVSKPKRRRQRKKVDEKDHDKKNNDE
tara:strand:- start:1695 stop:2084 length:390 start_codon:yes stop_codon:yes gene_type:complete